MSETTAAGMARLAWAARRPDPRQIAVVHRFLRREFARLPAAVAGAPAQETERADDLAQTFDLLAGAVRRHHTGTDDLLWPLVADRTGGQFGPAARAFVAHQRLTELLGRGRDGFARWRHCATAATRDQLADTLAVTAATLSRQLDDIENDLLPLVVAHVTVDEWDQFVDHEQADVPRARLPVLLAGLLAESDATDRSAVLGRLPMTTRLLWYSRWQWYSRWLWTRGRGGTRRGAR